MNQSVNEENRIQEIDRDKISETDLRAMAAIKRIVESGDRAEVRLAADGRLKIYAVRRKVMGVIDVTM